MIRLIKWNPDDWCIRDQMGFNEFGIRIYKFIFGFQFSKNYFCIEVGYNNLYCFEILKNDPNEKSFAWHHPSIWHKEFFK
jgi:hypothetical protein